MLIALSKTSFQPSHYIDYGLGISAQNPRSTNVVSVVSRFCTVFGRDKKIGAKRARAKNVKYFSTFWTDGYKLNLSTAHAEKWKEYQNIKNAEDKELLLQVHWMPLETPCMQIWNLQATLKCSSVLKL